MSTGKTGRRCLGMVLTKRNVELLKKEKPIHFSAEDMGLPDFKVNDILILFCETEEKFKKFAEEEGLIGELTKIHEVRREVQ